MKSFSTMILRRFSVLGLLSVLVLSTGSLRADGIGDKVEELGTMNALLVTDLRSAERDGLLHVQAEVSNDSPGKERLFYRFKWLDEDGFSVWDEEPWKPVVIYGKQRYLIKVVAPTPRATDFRLVLQSPNNTTDEPSSETWPDKY